MKRLHACPARCVMTHALLILTLILMGGCSSVGDGAGGTTAEEIPTENTSETDTEAEDTTDETVDETAEDPECDECGANQVCVDGECVCEPGYLDCDMDPENGCEALGECPCEVGSQRSCYFGPAGTEGVGICQAGVETCQAGGQWGYCEALPWLLQHFVTSVASQDKIFKYAGREVIEFEKVEGVDV